LPSHKKEKETDCNVKGCKESAKRVMSGKKVKDALKAVDLKDPDKKRMGLCKTHYKEYKKITRPDRLTERLGWEKQG
jgi:hypothetical protein